MNNELSGATAKMTTIDVIAHQQALLNMTNAELAKRVGFKTQNIVTMIKKGEMRIPQLKVMPIAKAIGADPLNFLYLWSEETNSDLQEIIEVARNAPMLTPNQFALAAELKEVSHGVDIDIRDYPDALESMKRAYEEAILNKIEEIRTQISASSVGKPGRPRTR